MMVAAFFTQFLIVGQKPADPSSDGGEAPKNCDFGDLLTASLGVTEKSPLTRMPESADGAADTPGTDEIVLGTKDAGTKPDDGLTTGTLVLQPFWFQSIDQTQPSVQSQRGLGLIAQNEIQNIGTSFLTNVAQFPGSDTNAQPNGIAIEQAGGDGATVNETADVATSRDGIESDAERNGNQLTATQVIQGGTALTQSLVARGAIPSLANPNSVDTRLSESIDKTTSDANSSSASIGTLEVKTYQVIADDADGQENVRLDKVTHAEARSMASPDGAHEFPPPTGQTSVDLVGATAPALVATNNSQIRAVTPGRPSSADSIEIPSGKGKRAGSGRSAPEQKDFEVGDPVDAIATGSVKSAQQDPAPNRSGLFSQDDAGLPVEEKNSKSDVPNFSRQLDASDRPIATSYQLSSSVESAENSKDGLIATNPWRPVVERIVAEIGGHLRIGKQEAIIQLDPPELGKIRIELRIDGDKIEARIATEEHGARTLLESHLPQLRQALEVGRTDVADVRIDNRAWSSGNNGAWSQASEQSFERGGQPGHRHDGAPAGTSNHDVAAEKSRHSVTGTNRISMWA